MRHRAATQWSVRGLAQLRPPRDGRGKPVWWVHRSVHPNLDPGSADRDRRNRESLLARYPEHLVDRAYRKDFWLARWRDLCTAEPRATELSLAARIVNQARRREGDAFRISPRSLRAWRRAYNTAGDDGSIRGIEALIDAYNGPAGSTRRSADAIDYFYALYHSQAKHSVQTCHDATLREAARNAWSWPSSYTATTRWLRANDRLDETCLRREGQTAFAHKHLPHIEIDYTTIEPGWMYVADHARLDLWCNHSGEQLRPWLTAIEDCRSRCLVGWHIGVSPNQDAILSAMRMAFAQWAVPHRFHIDQGKDFCSELLTGVTKRERDVCSRQLGPDWQQVLRHQQTVFWHGVLGELGVGVVYADPYCPWSKGQIERFFGTVHDQFDKTFATYCGRDTVSRPECLAEIRRGYTNSQKRALRAKHGKAWKRIAVLKFIDQVDVPSLDLVRDRFTDYVELYHRRSHGGLDGQTPRDVWRTATSLRKAGSTELLALMQARGVYRVGANGVTFRVGPTTLTYGATSSPLRRLVGRDVFITLDPADCSSCYAFTPDPTSRVLIDHLAANVPIPAGTPVDQLREAVRNVRSRRKLLGQAAREAPKRMRTAAREVAALRSDQLAAARATGTDDAAPTANIVPVRTGFEAVSIPDRTVYEPPPSEYDAVNLDDLDFNALHRSNADQGPTDEYADLDVDALTPSTADPAPADPVDQYADLDVDALTPSTVDSAPTDVLDEYAHVNVHDLTPTPTESQHDVA